MTIDKKNNDNIDRLLQIRQDSAYAYAKATKELLENGVKISLASTGEMAVPASFNDHLAKFNLSNLEFEWIAKYDGTKPDTYQFDPSDGSEHHFKHIDQDRLTSISFISNFNWPTDNIEKRVIVTLNMQNGLFSFMNGFASQEVKAKYCIDEVHGPKKLILFTKKRQSQMVGELAAELQEFHPPVDEILFYNRFVLGFEMPDGTKRVVIIQPNGNIDLWE